MKTGAAADIARPARGEAGSAATPHRLALRVYYEDTDFSGSVYHASYLRFLERGRTELLRALDIEHSKIFAAGGARGCHFVVRAMALEFLRPAFMDDLLSVETGIGRIGGASIEMRQAIRRGHEFLLTADVRIALVGGGRARRIPAQIADKLKAPPAWLAAVPPNFI
ncbi:MAG: YbgC/FadM family acyl-CoA thioesterase [Methylocapsa sp.]|nr:YbgC/FadM family acyl-CoA thioesterase [Methylocapsa sp.]